LGIREIELSTRIDNEFEKPVYSKTRGDELKGLSAAANLRLKILYLGHKVNLHLVLCVKVPRSIEPEYFLFSSELLHKTR